MRRLVTRTFNSNFDPNKLEMLVPVLIEDLQMEGLELVTPTLW